MSPEIRVSLEMATRAFGILATVEAIFVAPLAYLLPSSRLALIAAVAILLCLNASIVAAIGHARSIPLHVSNIAACGIGLGLVLVPILAFPMSAAVTGVLCLLLIVLGCAQLPDRTSKLSLAVQAGALATILIAWTTIRRHGLASGEENLAVDHMQMGLRFLLGAPLLLVAIANFHERLRGSRNLILLIAVCAGQIGIGFFELGGVFQVLPLIIAGFVFVGTFLLLVAFAVAFYRPTRA